MSSDTNTKTLNQNSSNSEINNNSSKKNKGIKLSRLSKDEKEEKINNLIDNSKSIKSLKISELSQAIREAKDTINTEAENYRESEYKEDIEDITPYTKEDLLPIGSPTLFTMLDIYKTDEDNYKSYKDLQYGNEELEEE